MLVTVFLASLVLQFLHVQMVVSTLLISMVILLIRLNI